MKIKSSMIPTKNIVKMFAEAINGNYTEEKFFASYITKDGKMGTTITIFNVSNDDSLTYYITMKNNKSFYFMGNSEDDLAKDLEAFSGITKSEKEYYMNEWDFTPERWDAWNNPEA